MPDLNAIEEANGYRELIERFSYSQEQVSDIIGKSRSHVANTLRLLKLPDSVRAYVQDGKLTAGHARALVGRPDAEELAKRILDTDMNVREAEAMAQAGPIGQPGSTGAGRFARRIRIRGLSRRTLPIRSASRSRSSAAPAKPVTSSLSTEISTSSNTSGCAFSARMAAD